MTSPDPPHYRKYGVPLYGASWLPVKLTADQNSGDSDESSSPPSSNFLILAGGGGEGRSGIPNELLLTDFDFASISLPDRPVFRLGTGADLPYRIAVHPRGEGLICAFPNNCRWYDWKMPNSSENGKLELKSSDKVLTQLEDGGQQLALAFNEDGSLLAVGGEDGKLRVFKWPSLEILINEENAYKAVKDLHFSVDGKYLATTGSGGPCRIWDVAASKVAASLQKEKDEIFGFCRFSQSSDGNQVLYTTAMQSKGGSVLLWDTGSWKRLTSKRINCDQVTAFTVSADGKLLAIGTMGDVIVIDATKMRVQMVVKKAHLGFVTALTFSNDSRALGSASMDSSVRVTMIVDKKAKGFNFWIIMLILLLAIGVYYLKGQGIIPETVPFLKS